MADDREERIRQRAYDLWQREGAPEGRDQDHWHEAVAQIDAEMAEGNEVAPGTAAAAGLAGRGDDLPLNADGLDEMDVEQARGAVGDGPGEEIADTTPATGTRRKAAARELCRRGRTLPAAGSATEEALWSKRTPARRR